jgi:hypothetical protein
LIAISLPLHAEMLAKEAIPEKIISLLLKRHPEAYDIGAEQKTHFKQNLYEVLFKEGESKQIELFRADGHFFTNAEKMDSLGEMPATARENLTAELGKYELVESFLIANPNGIGEEYDLVVNATGVIWHITVDSKGNISKKDKQ